MTDSPLDEHPAGQGPGGEGSLRALFGAVLQQLPAGVVIAEAPSGTIILGNAKADAIWRYPFFEGGPDDFSTRRGFHPDGRPYRADEWPLARCIASGESVPEEEVEIQRGDGTRGIIRVSASPVRDASGRVVAAVATLFDVTQQKAHERARRFLNEASAVLSSSLDFETTLRNLARLAVPTLADWCAVDILAEGGGVQRLAAEHVDPELRQLAADLAHRFPPDLAAEHGVARVLRTGEPELIPEVPDEMLTAVARSPEHLQLLRRLGLRSAMLVPLVARGRVLGALSLLAAESGRRFGPDDFALARELAARAALSIDNARLYHESQAANRAKSDFLAVMSHELRTPLTAIIGYTELLELGIPEPVTERQREQIERVELAARHLQQLIEEILTVTTLENGTSRIRRQSVRAGELLQRADAIARPMALAKELELRVEPLVDDVEVETDPDKALQVLLNLMSNAIKFTDQGSVVVSSRRTEDALEIAVRDTGIGLETKHLEQIFDPFWQVEQPITRRAGGTGLGLTISRRLIDLLGGEIRVQSDPGRGSTFTAVFPLRLPPSSGATSPAT